jgi:purine-binding chemotaxis protein CheW
MEDLKIDLGIDADEELQKNKYLTFEIGKNVYAINIQFVRDIIGFQDITAVPEIPEYLKGIINLRGQIIPVMDVRERFGIDQIEYHARTCIIVTENKKRTVGLIVDEVHEVQDILENQIDPIIEKQDEISYISGLGKVGDEVKIVIDLDKLLDKTYGHHSIEQVINDEL